MYKTHTSIFLMSFPACQFDNCIHRDKNFPIKKTFYSFARPPRFFLKRDDGSKGTGMCVYVCVWSIWCVEPGSQMVQCVPWPFFKLSFLCTVSGPTVFFISTGKGQISPRNPTLGSVLGLIWNTKNSFFCVYGQWRCKIGLHNRNIANVLSGEE